MSHGPCLDRLAILTKYAIYWELGVERENQFVLCWELDLIYLNRTYSVWICMQIYLYFVNVLLYSHRSKPSIKRLVAKWRPSSYMDFCFPRKFLTNEKNGRTFRPLINRQKRIIKMFGMHFMHMRVIIQTIESIIYLLESGILSMTPITFILR